MDAREREASQLHRTSIKRPWDEEPAFSERPNLWHGAGLPPIEVGPAQRATGHSEAEQEPRLNTLPVYERGSTKRRRYEGYNYSSIPGDVLDVNRSRASYSQYEPNPISVDSPRFPSPSQQRTHEWGRHIVDSEGAADGLGLPTHKSQQTFLCRRCRRLTTPSQDGDDYASCWSCNQSPELALVTQRAAAALTQLGERLSDLASQYGNIRTPDRRDASAACPPIAQFGLKPTFDWILDNIYYANELADRIAQHPPPSGLQNLQTPGSLNRPSTGSGLLAQDGLPSIMKPHMDSESEDAFRTNARDLEPTSDPRLLGKRRSLETSVGSHEDPTVMRSGNDYPSLSTIDRGSRRASIMNPPPAPTRQLPSPPGRSIHSPTQGSFPSPSTSFNGSTTQPLNLPSLPNVHSASTYLPPIASAHGPDALQAHTAALQHEVSVQKIALSSLQGEHDKLLAAFSRSQARASALEKRHAVSDTEIIGLSEEKLRLQAQVIELERDTEELSRSRDEYRQAAVQESAQYVEIVKKASRLEEMAAEERKEWNKLKAELEARIEALAVEKNLLVTSSPGQGKGALEENPSSIDQAQGVPNDESAIEPKPPTHPKDLDVEHDRALLEEVQHLRRRCMEMEHTLRVIRKEGEKMERMVEALGLTGKLVLEEVDRLLSPNND